MVPPPFLEVKATNALRWAHVVAITQPSRATRNYRDLRMCFANVCESRPRVFGNGGTARPGAAWPSHASAKCMQICGNLVYDEASAALPVASPRLRRRCKLPNLERKFAVSVFRSANCSRISLEPIETEGMQVLHTRGAHICYCGVTALERNRGTLSAINVFTIA